MELAAYGSRTPVNDTQLITRVVAGDATAERELYETYVDRIYRLAFRIAGDDELAQDFTQSTFIRAFEKIGSFRGESSLSTWLHSIGVSVALNGLRKTKRQQNRELPIEEGLLVGTTSREAEPDLKDRMAKAIDSLSDKYRMVFHSCRCGEERPGPEHCRQNCAGLQRLGPDVVRGQIRSLRQRKLDSTRKWRAHHLGR